MDNVFGKNKGKRPRSATSGGNESLVQRVSDLFKISKWFGSPSRQSNVNGSPKTSEPSDSSSEDENDGPITKPPLKRMRYDGETSSSVNHVEAQVHPAPDLKIPPTRSIENNMEPQAGASTQRNRPFESSPLRSSTSLNPEELRSISTPSPQTQFVLPTKRTSLFNKQTPDAKPSPEPTSSKSSYKQISSNAPVRSRFIGSTFYPGYTMYGGASASSFHLNGPNIKQMKTAIVAAAPSNDDTVLSQSTKRIMDLLENYSSPLLEAKRIPPMPVKTINFTSNSYILDTSETKGQGNPSKTQELRVPSVASLLRIKQRARLMEGTSAARRIAASQSSTAHILPYNSGTSYGMTLNNDQSMNPFKDHGGKLKTKTFRARESTFANSAKLTELLPPLNLPSATLAIESNNLPKFSFDIAPSNIKSSTCNKPDIVESNSFKQKQDESRITLKRKYVPSSQKFIFSSPLQVEDDSSEEVDNAEGYKFRTPAKVPIKKKNYQKSILLPPTEKTKPMTFGTVQSLSESNKEVSEAKKNNLDWKCDTCWIMNKIDLEKCAACSATKPTNKDMTPPKEKSEKWKCVDCWIMNENKLDKCAACGGAKPLNKSEKTQNSASEIKIYPLQVPVIESTWKCESCWIMNKQEVDTCAACGGSKPDTIRSSQPISNQLPIDSTFSSIIKTQQAKWECKSCLTRNDSTVTSCVCCNALKPDSTSQPDKQNFNFLSNSAHTFKFGIDANEKDLSSINPQTKKEETTTEKCTVSETNNNVFPKMTTTFSFGIPKDASKETAAVRNTENKEEKSSSTFSFGVPTLNVNQTLKPSNPLKVNSDDKSHSGLKTDSKTNPKKEETSVISLSKPLQFGKPDQLPQNIFSSEPKKSDSKTSSSSTNLVSVFKLPENPKAIETANPIENSVTNTDSKPSFSFNADNKTQKSNSSWTCSACWILNKNEDEKCAACGGPQSKIPAPVKAASVFSSVQPPSTLSVLGATPTQATTTTSTTMSLFGNPTVSTVAPTAAAAAVPTGPIFSFGTNGPTSTQVNTQDKSKFNFSFGATTNKVESPHSFPTFGGSVQGDTINKLPTSTVSKNLFGNIQPQAQLQTQPQECIFGSLQQNNVSTGSLFPATNNTTLSKPAAFTFGSASASGFTNPAPSFGSTAPSSTTNLFGMGSQNNNIPTNNNTLGSNQPNSMFQLPTQNAPASLFGSAAPSASVQPMGMFGSPNAGATPTFGSPNPPSIPTFEVGPHNPAQAPAFNFGSPQSTGMFGFGQQQQQQQSQPQQQPFAFGAVTSTPLPGPGVQFNMGSVGTGSARRMRKAIRRYNTTNR